MKELRVYVINVNDVDFENEMPVNTAVSELSDKKFIEIAERQGGVYTLQGFQNAFNNEEVSTFVGIIRFIEVDV